MEIILISYVIQIPLALYAAFGVPRPAGLGEKTQRLRTLVIVFGVLPCGPLSVLAQVVYLAMYFGAVKVNAGRSARQERAFNQAVGGTSASSSGNPFGRSSTPKPATSDQNPFGSAQPATPASGSNPFTDAGGSGTGSEEPRADNPFA